ncbi:MAG TPA: YadA-like family protein, partial [bacterium]|nr:YadA-like family protein [bacterium]
AVALGFHSDVSMANGTALGLGSAVSAVDSVAVGANSSASADNSVALGAHSTATRANTVSVGDSGTGLTRQITNVAPGTARSDAATVGQLDDAIQGQSQQSQSYARGIGALSSAATSAAVTAAGLPGHSKVALGVGSCGDQAAMGLAYAQTFGSWGATINGAYSGTSTQVGAGAGFSW